MLRDIIKELEDLRGAKVQVFGQDTVLDNKPEDDDFIIDTVDVIKNIDSIDNLNEVTDFSYEIYLGYLDNQNVITLESGEELEAKNFFYKLEDIADILERHDISIEEFFDLAVESGDTTEFEDEDGEKYYDIELVEEIVLEADDPEEYLEKLEEIYYIEEMQCGNTFNGSSPLNHHINFTFYENKDIDAYYVLIRCHRYGDVRGNYTDYALLEARDMESIYNIFDYSKSITFEMEIDDEEVEVVCQIFTSNDTMNINIQSLDINHETYSRDSIDEVKEYIMEEVL